MWKGACIRGHGWSPPGGMQGCRALPQGGGDRGTEASKGKGAQWAGREKQKGKPSAPSWAFQPEESTHTRALFESITSY